MNLNNLAFKNFAQSKKAFRKVLGGALLAVLTLGTSDTARAQGVQLTPSTTQLTFSNIAQNSSSQQTVQLTTNQATTVAIQAISDTGWLTVTPGPNANVTTSLSLTVIVKTNNALSLGTHVGQVNISVSGQPQNVVTIAVTLIVGSGSGGIVAFPTMLAFTAKQGDTTSTPLSPAVMITTSGAAFNYTVSGTTTDNRNWLRLPTNFTGTTGDAGFAVTADPTGLGAGSFSGTIIVQSTANPGVGVSIPVTLTVTSTASLTVSPANPPPFLYQLGGSVPLSPLTLNIAATIGTLNFKVQNPTVTWLVPTQFTGMAGTNPVQVLVNIIPSQVANFAPGNYPTTLQITTDNGSAPLNIPINLVVSSHPLLVFDNVTALNFTAQSASQPPPDQTVNLKTVGSGPSVGFAYVSDPTASWLTVTPSGGTTPASLNVHVNPSALSAGSYTGTITVSPTNGDTFYNQTLPVNLTVANGAVLSAAPSVVQFSHQIGQTPPSSQTINILSSTPQLNISAMPFILNSNCGANWLNPPVLQATTAPTTLTIGVLTTGLNSALQCSGKITLTYGSGQTLDILVTLNVSVGPQLVIRPEPGFGSYTLAPDSQTPFNSPAISLSSTDNSQVDFSAGSTNDAWVQIGPGQGKTPARLNATIFSTGDAPGNYHSSISINSSTLPGPFVIPIALTVTSNVMVTATPNTNGSPLGFSLSQFGQLPANQNVVLTSTGGNANYTTSTSVPWLSVTPATGTVTPATSGVSLSVGVTDNSLSPGSYPGQILVSLPNSATPSLTIFVVLTVTSPQALTVNPSQTFTFTYQLGTPQPAPQRFRVTSSGAPLAFSVATTSSGWLSTDLPKGQGTTPMDVNILVNATGLAVGNYNGSVTVSAAGVSGTTTLNVVLTVTAPPPPTPVTIVNNGSFAAGLIAPGEIITIFGTNLGPATLTSFVLNAQGGVDSTLAGVQVLFNGKAGTPLHVSATQIDVIVPYEVAGQATTSMVVQYLGVSSAPFNLSVAVRAPGIYTINSAGLQAAALNQNGTVNGTGANGTTYASQDTDVVLYATGGGQTSPASTTGSVTPAPPPFYKIPNVTATIGGQPAVVDFAGGAPGLVAGAIQLNIHIPKGLTGDALQVVVTIDGVPSPLTGPGGQGPSIAVR